MNNNGAMQTTLTTTGDTYPNTTVGNITYYPNYQPYYQTYPTYQWIQAPPLVCSGDVHVFPCPHCDKCKCGSATKLKQKR